MAPKKFATRVEGHWISIDIEGTGIVSGSPATVIYDTVSELLWEQNPHLTDDGVMIDLIDVDLEDEFTRRILRHY